MTDTLILHRVVGSTSSTTYQSSPIPTAASSRRRAVVQEVSSSSLGFDLAAESLSRMRSDHRQLISQIEPHTWPQIPVSSRQVGAIALLDNWLGDDSGYDEKIWPEIAQAIEDNRLSDRRRLGPR